MQRCNANYICKGLCYCSLVSEELFSLFALWAVVYGNTFHYYSLKGNFMQNERPVIITILSLYDLLSHLQNEKEDILKVMFSIFFPLYCNGFFSKLQKQCENYH